MKRKPTEHSGKAEIVRLSLGPLQTNCYLAADTASGKAAVIDPGDETWRVQHALAMHEWSLAWVLVTHGHFDHIAACGQLAGQADCPIALHPADLPLWWMHGGAGLFGLQIPDQPEPRHSLTEGEHLAVGSLSFEVIHLPGHTPGGVGFLESRLGWLFSGDVVFAEGVGRTDLPGGSQPALMQSLAKILRLPEAVTVYPGHGGPTTVKALRSIWGEPSQGRPPTVAAP